MAFRIFDTSNTFERPAIKRAFVREAVWAHADPVIRYAVSAVCCLCKYIPLELDRVTYLPNSHILQPLSAPRKHRMGPPSDIVSGGATVN